MKIKLLSDLHLEFSPFTIPYNGEDVLILAGDIAPDYEETIKLVSSYLELTKDTEIIFVLGNHDYYHHSIKDVDQKWKEFSHGRFHFLQDDSVVIGNIRFYGTTMWTDMHKGDKKVMLSCQMGINDFRLIKGFTPTQCLCKHLNSAKMLGKALNRSKEPVVVVTHHLPSYKSINSVFEGSSLNPAYASTDLDELVKHKNVIMWCHGHTHHNLNYNDGGTRVLCNPRGYVKRDMYGNLKKENPLFDETLNYEFKFKKLEMSGCEEM